MIRRFRLCLLQFGHFRNRTRVYNPLGNCNRNRRPFPINTFHLDRTIHQFRQMFYNGKPQSGSFRAPVPLGIHLAKVLKNLAKVFLANTASGILHAKHKQLFFLIFSGFPGNRDAYITCLREFNGIVDNIDQNLFDSAVISAIAAGNRLVTLIFQNQSALGSRHIHHCYNLFRQLFDIILRIYQLHFARFDLGEIQNIIDDRQKAFCCRLHIFGMRVNPGIAALLHNKVVQPDDGIHRRPDLMRHIGKKLAFRNAGFFRLAPNLLNFINICIHIGHIQD